ncbi:unnamed protein product [Rangifer tarandus platyrhynchus]|uniref:Uncharacterized protein n=1 Tax=Rangifer tarandus platyrhynchus TaxID=3082113 RepID=A0AC59YK84_RANTA
MPALPSVPDAGGRGRRWTRELRPPAGRLASHAASRPLQEAVAISPGLSVFLADQQGLQWTLPRHVPFGEGPRAVPRARRLTGGVCLCERLGQAGSSQTNEKPCGPLTSQPHRFCRENKPRKAGEELDSGDRAGGRERHLLSRRLTNSWGDSQPGK